MSRFHKTKSRYNFRKKLVPIVNNSLNTVGNTVKKVSVNSAPIVEKGVSAVYNAFANGFNFGAKTLSSKLKISKNKRYNKNYTRKHNKHYHNRKPRHTRKY
jgi:hypothetical protein